MKLFYKKIPRLNKIIEYLNTITKKRFITKKLNKQKIDMNITKSN